ncbi:hypothetical protein N7519_008360 [Penicillium mononematosum]|uniref:uncharacterized protein n=1 Tax=Penicillium mononematosum TaxID=268346 RepID=UPI0025497305|nr:uncharacterized protein N7519_008360 [Penicillium mononematosum]KAJ6177899.1 hypothetical protein N7519_008360 [Penicillium mononematosum]
MCEYGVIPPLAASLRDNITPITASAVIEAEACCSGRREARAVVAQALALRARAAALHQAADNAEAAARQL